MRNKGGFHSLKFEKSGGPHQRTSQRLGYFDVHEQLTVLT